ncbi:N-acetylmuramic acid/N-acetylglucosamine kinase [Hypsizygus marmoreus]|uniref:N-acetyl-D-glucosamine kinase n=1 Tax=Hypsizygus marmoreus TaxID=39966 RepID=A0A369JVG4_HYPMA|nr:N-acetylmuramic acid/N-acetylglucosamine kinase [Hypsizygus marmoreus]
MSLYLCADCGGSKTSVAICDTTGRILGRALGGPSNFAYLTLDDFISAVTEAVSNALKTCAAPPSDIPIPLPPAGASPFAAAWFGVSGVDSPAAVAAITPALSTLLGIPEGPRLAVANDTHLLAAPVRMYPDVSHAVTVIGGTGSNVVTFRETEGSLQELGRIGGWGWILGDEGGGFHVGREAIRQIMLEHDKASIGGAPPLETILTGQIMEYFGIKNSDVMEILPIIHLPDPSSNKNLSPDSPPHHHIPREKRLSSLSPLVFKAAFEHGDALALRILCTCASHLASQVAVLLSNGGDNAPRAVKAEESLISFGGSLVGIEGYRKLILDDLAERGHTFKYVEFVGDAAAVGAVSLAMVRRALDNVQE